MSFFLIRLAGWARGGRVQRGFRDALEVAWADLFPYMNNLADQSCKIGLAGHSLGAALVTLAADRFQDVQGLYTFGSPRVGDRQFQENFRLRAYRVVNGDDTGACLRCYSGPWSVALCGFSLEHFGGEKSCCR